MNQVKTRLEIIQISETDFGKLSIKETL